MTELATSVSFFVPGSPVPGGSKRAFPFKRKNGKLGVAVSDMSGERGKNWRAAVRLAGSEAMAGRPPFDCALWMSIDFTMPRPRSHYRTGKRSAQLKEGAPRWHTIAPDRSKITRLVEDSLKGVVVRDDCLIVDGPLTKQYGDRPGARITIAPCPEPYTVGDSPAWTR